jgi:secreted trypsin-like serine protease
VAGRALLLAVLLALLHAPGVPAGPPKARSTIVGGQTAAVGNWPSIAFVLAGWDGDGNGTRESLAQCTGTVIAPQWVISAAHCAFQPNGRLIDAMVTVTGVADPLDAARETIAADQVIVHPSWNPWTLNGDVLLIHLQSASSRPPMPLARPDRAYEAPLAVPNSAGWGALDEDATLFTNVLQEAHLALRTNADCVAVAPMFDAATQRCAGTKDATGACVGDSGGPLVVFDPATGAPALWGVTSYGPQIRLGLPVCSLRAPAVFTWVPAFVSWIAQTVTPPAPPPVVEPARDTVAPVLSRVRLAKHRIRAGRRTTLSFRLSEAAAVTVTLLRKRRSRLKPILSVPFGAPAGTVKRGFAARARARPLGRGGYALRVAAVDTAGNRAKPVSVAFRVVR